MGQRYLPAGRRLVLSCLVLLCSVLSCAILFCLLPPPAHAATRYFRGMLDDQLQVDSDRFTVWTWQAATSDELRRLNIERTTVAHAYAGECLLSDDAKKPVHGRLVHFKDGHWVAYLDLNRDGIFGPGERAALDAPRKNAHTRAVARFEAALTTGSYRQMPVLVALPLVNTAGPGAQTVYLGVQPFLEGHVQLADGPVLMRFSYSPTEGSLHAAETEEWMDVDRDGSIDATPGSPEIGVADGSPPIFHVKDLYLQTTVIDADTRTYTMKTVPADAYHRIEMGVGDKLPDFTFHNLEGKKRHLSDIKGDYRLLDFWASWCAPCIAQLPELKAAYARYSERGFEILGMNGDEDPAKAAAVLNKLDISWPQASLDEELQKKRFQIYFWPTLVLIDRHNKVVSISQPDHLPLGGKDLEKTLEALMP